MNYLRLLNLEVTLFTNGTLLSFEKMQKYSAIIDKYIISFDSPQEIHDKLRGFRGSYKKCLELFDAFSKIGVDFSLQMTVGEENLAYMQSVADIADFYGAQSVKYANIIKIGRGMQYDKVLEGSTPEFISNLEKIKEKYKNKFLINANIERYQVLLEKYGKNIIPNVVWVCATGKIQLLTSTLSKTLEIGTISRGLENNMVVSEKLKNANRIIKTILQENEDRQWINLFEKLEYYFRKKGKRGKNMYAIEVDDLCRSFKQQDKSIEDKHKVLQHISIKVNKGEIYGLIGKNGAGKTTLIKILTTLLLPETGKVTVNGYDVEKDEQNVRRSLGVVLSNNRALYLKLTALENMKFFADLYQLSGTEKNKRIKELLRFADLWDVRNEYVEHFSHGMLQKLNIIRALLPDPPILILDEPTNGLDVDSVNALRKMILLLNREGKTVFLTTHSMEEINILADRVGVLDGGELVKEGTPRMLKEAFPYRIFEISLKRENTEKGIDKLEKVLLRKVSVKAEEDERLIALRFAGDKNWDLEMVMHLLKDVSLKPEKLSVKEPELEDIFVCFGESEEAEKG